MQRQNELQNIRNSVSRTIADAIKNCGVRRETYAGERSGGRAGGDESERIFRAAAAAAAAAGGDKRARG